jgi:hypothetical protein
MFPHIMRQMPRQQFINKIHGPKNPVENKVEYGVIIIPADHHGINTQKQINDTGIPVSHDEIFYVQIKYKA